MPVSAVPVLPPTVTPGIRAAVPVPPSTAACIIAATALAVSGLTARPRSCGFVAHDGRAVRRDDAVDDVGPHHDAVVRDRRGDHRHLQRRHEQPLLAEREPARIDVGVLLRVEELRPLVEAARRALVRRRLERRRRVEAEALRVLDELLRAELLADVAEDRVDRVLQRRAQVEAAERRGRVVVVDALAVDLAVAGVDEARRGREAARVDRGRGGDDLEGRARRVEAGGGAVEERVRALAAARTPVARPKLPSTRFGS